MKKRHVVTIPGKYGRIRKKQEHISPQTRDVRMLNISLDTLNLFHPHMSSITVNKSTEKAFCVKNYKLEFIRHAIIYIGYVKPAYTFCALVFTPRYGASSSAVVTPPMDAMYWPICK